MGLSDRSDQPVVLWRCKKGHWTSHPQENAGAPHNPRPVRDFHCPYPCMAPCTRRATFKEVQT